jgi:hypothetical protein
MSLRRGVKVIRILGIAERRDSYPLARLLYEDQTAPSGTGEPGSTPRE